MLMASPKKTGPRKAYEGPALGGIDFGRLTVNVEGGGGTEGRSHRQLQ